MATMQLSFSLCVHASSRIDVRSLLAVQPSREHYRQDDDVKVYFYDAAYGSKDFLESLLDFLKIVGKYTDALKGTDVKVDLWCLVETTSGFTGLVIDSEAMRFMSERAIDFFVSVYGNEAETSGAG